MNYKVMGRFISKILAVEAVFMTPAMLISVFDKEYKAFISFVLSILIIMAVSALLFVLGRKAKQRFFVKEGLACVGLSWIAISLLGCLPFYISGEIPHFIDALFEMVSGFTTTGSSILPEVETMSRGMLYWRSFSHWLGGMGVLVFLLAVTPANGRSNRFTLHLLRAESPGPNVEKLAPRMRDTAMILYMLYMALTVINVIFLLLGGMSLFDSVCTAFGTAGTGGFGIKNDSMGSYSAYLQWVVTIFMILFGVNFNAFYLILYRKFKKAFRMEEVRYYFLIIFASIAIITMQILHTSAGIFDALRHASFQVASIITTTGYSTIDFNLWSQTCKTILILLMFVGACAGSTGGGIKVSRFVILCKTVKKELNAYIHPKSIKKINFEHKTVEHEVVRATNVYFITYMILFAFSVFAISFDGNDLITNFTAVAATINNIGPGLELVGPTQNFGLFSGFSKFVLMFDMLAGRLELFPLLLLFHPTLWKEIASGKIRKLKK